MASTSAGRGNDSDAGQLSTTALDMADMAKVVADVGLDSMLDELIDRLRDAIRAFDPTIVEDRVRTGFNYTDPELGLVEWMPAMRVGSTVAVKTVGYHPRNPTARNIPSVLATTALYDTTSGHLLSICEATLLTALRTGAASALMTEALTADRPLRLGVVGAGAQAVTQIHAISRVRELAVVSITDVDRDVAETMASRLPGFEDRIRVRSGDEFAADVPSFDVVTTATSVGPGAGPVVDLTSARPDVHVNAVGADFPGKTELPIDFLRSAVVVPDVVEQCLLEGEAQQLSVDELGPDMVSVLRGEGAELVDCCTVFDSTGWAYEDLVAAQLFAEHAQRLGLGRRLQMFHNPIDPYDPYEAVRI